MKNWIYLLAIVTTGNLMAEEPVRKVKTSNGSYEIYKMSEFELRTHLRDEAHRREALDAVEDVAEAASGVVRALSAGKVWVIGKKVYEIIKENEAVLNVSTDHWSVLPEGTANAMDLFQWQKPEYSGWIVNYKNLFGMTAARVSFLTSYSYGGKMNGNGSYLANVTVIPRDVHSLWGYSLDMDAEAFEAINEGTQADPVAGLTYHVRIRVGTILKKSVLDFQYHVNGLGELEIVPVD